MTDRRTRRKPQLFKAGGEAGFSLLVSTSATHAPQCGAVLGSVYFGACLLACYTCTSTQVRCNSLMFANKTYSHGAHMSRLKFLNN
jgi:hypothetical protein